ncbi:MAG TPA: hypothetical protein VJ036_04370 [bacterium]|jgi:hypothetical protein|nr:hypothetical protein [bacterium]
MKQKKGTYAIVEATALSLIALLSFTILNKEYLFGWAAHNWLFYLILAVIPVLLLLSNWHFVSALMTAGIVLGLFGGNYLGNSIQMFNAAKITAAMPPDQVARLHYHPGFKIWILTILLFTSLGISLQALGGGKEAVRRALKAALGPSFGVVVGGVIFPRLMHSWPYNETYPPLLIHVAIGLVGGYLGSLLVCLVWEWFRSKG